MHGNPEVLRFLLDNKADMMKRTTGMEKALPVELCAVSGNAAGMAAMLSYGHPLQCDVDGFGNDFMHGACFCGSVEVAKMLVHRGFPPKANGWALCHLSAAALGPAPVEMTELLLESCEEIRAAKNPQSGEGATGIAWMILTGCQAANFVSNDKFFAFMSEWAGSSPLHMAAMRGNVNLVKLLMGHGFDMTVQNARGRTPIHLACLFGHVLVVRHFASRRGFSDAAQIRDTHAWKTARELVESSDIVDSGLLALLPLAAGRSHRSRFIDCSSVETNHATDDVSDAVVTSVTSSVLLGRNDVFSQWPEKRIPDKLDQTSMLAQWQDDDPREVEDAELLL